MEKMFLAEIDSLDNENGCFASNSYFADFFGITKGRCTQIIKSLEAKKRITIVLKREGKQVVKRLIRVVNKLNNPSENIKHPYLENDEDNNTYINNTCITLEESQEKKEAKEVSFYLFEKILSVNKSFKGKRESWVKDIEKAIRIDKRTKQELIDCIDWIYNHPKGSFWIPNIMSGKKLRDRFDTMNMQAMVNPQNQQAQVIDAVLKARGGNNT